jgi:hypothetical protein
MELVFGREGVAVTMYGKKRTVGKISGADRPDWFF